MKLFVTDLDGTLLNSDHKLSEYSMNAIKTAMDKGIPICIATGRSYNDILEIISELALAFIAFSIGSEFVFKDMKEYR